MDVLIAAGNGLPGRHLAATLQYRGDSVGVRLTAAWYRRQTRAPSAAACIAGNVAEEARY